MKNLKTMKTEELVELRNEIQRELDEASFPAMITKIMMTNLTCIDFELEKRECEELWANE